MKARVDNQYIIIPGGYLLVFFFCNIQAYMHHAGLKLLFWMSGLVFWMSGFVFWVPGLVFWVSGFVLNCL